jgi:hypothetical protein
LDCQGRDAGFWATQMPNMVNGWLCIRALMKFNEVKTAPSPGAQWVTVAFKPNISEREKDMEANKLADLLKDEYVMLQTLYEDMDSKGLTIKNWAITVALAIIGTSILNDKKNLLWLAFAASLMFWYGSLLAHCLILPLDPGNRGNHKEWNLGKGTSPPGLLDLVEGI